MTLIEFFEELATLEEKYPDLITADSPVKLVGPDGKEQDIEDIFVNGVGVITIE